jgi:hypothetical protein
MNDIETINSITGEPIDYQNPLLNSVEFKRIEQTLVVLSNLSFEENNAEYMANKCPALFEFLVLCLHTKSAYIEFRKHALDILANISRKMKLKLLSGAHKNLLVISLTHLLIGNNDQQPRQQDQATADSISSNGPATMNSTIGASLLGGQDHLDVIRGLEILTKLCSQTVDLFDEENSNEKCIAKYSYTLDEANTSANVVENSSNHEGLFIERVIYRLEELLSVQDVLILLHALECLYQLSQNSKYICNLMVNYPLEDRVSKMVPILVNFLTVDMTHFGMQAQAAPLPTVVIPQQQQQAPMVVTAPQVVNQNQPMSAIVSNIPRTMPTVVATAAPVAAGGVTSTSVASTVGGVGNNMPGPIKMYKIVPSSGVATLIASTTNATAQPVQQQQQQQTHVFNNKGATLLQQTLNNNASQQQQQHVVFAMNSGATSLPAGNVSIQKVINPNTPQQQINQLMNRMQSVFFVVT